VSGLPEAKKEGGALQVSAGEKPKRNDLPGAKPYTEARPGKKGKWSSSR